jgi:hypothetical protein
MDDWVVIATIVGIVIVVGAFRKLTAASKGGIDKDPLGLKAGRGAANRRSEALFVSTFPELQPHFHPEKVLRFVSAWRPRRRMRPSGTIRLASGLRVRAFNRRPRRASPRSCSTQPGPSSPPSSCRIILKVA